MPRVFVPFVILAFGLAAGCGKTGDSNAPPPQGVQGGATGASGKETKGGSVSAPVMRGPPLEKK